MGPTNSFAIVREDLLLSHFIQAATSLPRYYVKLLKTLGSQSPSFSIIDRPNWTFERTRTGGEHLCPSRASSAPTWAAQFGR